MSEEPQAAFPAQGTKFFPDEGGIMWRGEAYYPAAYARQVTGVMVERGAEAFEAKWDAMIEAGDGERLSQTEFIQTAFRAGLTAALGGDEQ